MTNAFRFASISCCLFLCSATQAFAATWPTFSGAGDGENVPFQITNCAQLIEMQKNVLVYPGPSPSYALANDIDCSGVYPFNPIAIDNAEGWDGSLDGQNHKITGLMIGGAGLFASLGRQATIQNLYIVANVFGTSSVGILAGVSDSPHIYNVSVAGSVSGYTNIGGLIGAYTTRGMISHCSSSASVVGTNNVGGLIGTIVAYSAFADPFVGIDNSYATGKVSGNTDVGGFVGSTDAYFTITNSYASGDVLLIGDLPSIGGGFAGFSHITSFRNSFAKGSVTYAPGSIPLNVNSTGGFVGSTAKYISEDVYNFHSFQGDFYERYANAPLLCAGLDQSGLTSRAGACTAESDGEYFASETNQPLNVWDLQSTWKLYDDGELLLRDAAGPPTPTATVAPTATTLATPSAVPTASPVPTIAHTPIPSVVPSTSPVPTVVVAQVTATPIATPSPIEIDKHLSLPRVSVRGKIVSVVIPAFNAAKFRYSIVLNDAKLLLTRSVNASRGSIAVKNLSSGVWSVYYTVTPKRGAKTRSKAVKFRL